MKHIKIKQTKYDVDVLGEIPVWLKNSWLIVFGLLFIIFSLVIIGIEYPQTIDGKITIVYKNQSFNGKMRIDVKDLGLIRKGQSIKLSIVGLLMDKNSDAILGVVDNIEGIIVDESYYIINFSISNKSQEALKNFELLEEYYELKGQGSISLGPKRILNWLLNF